MRAGVTNVNLRNMNPVVERGLRMMQRLNPSKAMRSVLSRYGISSVFADREAKAILGKVRIEQEMRKRMLEGISLESNLVMACGELGIKAVVTKIPGAFAIYFAAARKNVHLFSSIAEIHDPSYPLAAMPENKHGITGDSLACPTSAKFSTFKVWTDLIADGITDPTDDQLRDAVARELDQRKGV